MRNASILYVDANSAVLHSTEVLLRSAGHSVTVARNATDGVLLLTYLSFDMVLLECVPAFTWLTAEAKRRHPNLRVAVCTDVPGFFQLPFVDAVVQKPLPPPVFLQKITALLSPSPATLSD